MRIAPAGVAAAILIAVASWWLLIGNVAEASAGFAEMLERVCQARTVAFDSHFRVPGEPETKLQVLMAFPGRNRITWPDGRVHIIDAAKGKYLTISSPVIKKAILRSSNVEADYGEPLERLRRAGKADGHFVRKETWNNQEVIVYQVDCPQGSMRVWVDPREELPVRIESRLRAKDGQEIVSVLDNFRWNPSISDSLFSLTAPVGYVLEAPESEPSEESLIELLRACAQMSNGSFPASLEPITVLDLVLKSHSEQVYHRVNAADKTFTDMNDQAKETYGTCLRGLAFIKRISENRTWQYAGGGVKLGDETSVVCWWNLPGLATYRAVYGDLKVRDVTADKLPLQGNSGHKSKDGTPNNETN